MSLMEELSPYNTCGGISHHSGARYRLQSTEDRAPETALAEEAIKYSQAYQEKKLMLMGLGLAILLRNLIESISRLINVIFEFSKFWIYGICLLS